jgi:1-acyl-sn-glycerol-3-phosphate acyltransferase
MKYLMATGRIVAAAGLMLAMAVVTPIQSLVIKPVFKNTTAVPRLFYKTLGAIFGINVKLHQDSAPIDIQRQKIAVANHMSIFDFVALGVKQDVVFAGKGDVLEWPGIAQMARSANYIGLKRASKKDAPEVYQKNLLKARSKLISELHNGNDLAYFPEGTTTDGKEVALFRAGLMKIFFNEAALGRNGEAVKLERDVVVQPIAIRVAAVNGKPVAAGDDGMRNSYSLPKAGMLGFFWKRALTRSTTLELKVFDPLDPKDFTSAEDLANEAQRLVRSFAAPNQTVVKKAVIPGMDESKKKQPEPQ